MNFAQVKTIFRISSSLTLSNILSALYLLMKLLKHILSFNRKRYVNPLSVMMKNNHSYFSVVNTAIVLNYVWPIFVIMHGRVKVLNVFKVKVKTQITQQTFTPSKSVLETLEKRCEIYSNLTIKTPERRH